MLARIAAVTLLLSCARPPAPPNEVVERAARAIGGRAAIDAARTLVVEGAGERFILGQSRAPGSPLIEYQVNRSRHAIDLVNGRWRQEHLLTPRFSTGHPDPQTDIISLDGEVAFDDAGEQARRADDSDARERRIALSHSPLAMIQEALAPGAVVSNHRRTGGGETIDVRTAGGEQFTLTVDGESGLPVEVTTMMDQSYLGDVAATTRFADYRAAGDLRLPGRITRLLDGTTLSDLRVTRYLVNGETGDLAAPASVKAAPPTRPPVVDVKSLAPGVWLLAGESHHSAVVELADSLLMIEAPLDDARTLAVIARARQLQPAKPLTHVVVTHHHLDHSGGVRAAVSQGLTIIAHEKNRGFVESMVSRPHTLAPDALARAPRPLLLQTVGARTVLGDSARTVELHAVDTEHADGMLVAHLPAERLLIEVDLYTVPAPEWPAPRSYPFAGALVDLVTSNRLDVERVVPLHQGMAPFADLVAAARLAPAPP